MEKLDTFTAAYITAALWSSADDNGNPLDRGEHELAPETRAAMVADCARFQKSCGGILASVESSDHPKALRMGCVDEQAGHDFWLTRCGHGAGFWDGDWPEPQASKLGRVSKAFGNVDLYIGDDGLIYAM